MYDFQVTPDGGDPYPVTATARDVLAWEKTAKGRTYSDLARNPALMDMYRLAHIASKRLGLFDGSLREFEETCEIDGQESREGDADPTRPAP